MSEPKYDEDVVNLGYLKKTLNNEGNSTDEIIINKHYGTKPNPPYYAGDTWSQGKVLYTCVNTRLFGFYDEADWVSESGAKEEAESKNKIYLTQPSDYSVGDMWILQSDDDHRAGKKGEILITTAGRKEYDDGDWVNMIGYGNVASINELANNINETIKLLGLNKESGTLNIIYSDEVPTSIINANDLWYATSDTEEYLKGRLYKYDGENYILIEDDDITNVFSDADQSILTTDGKIQVFYEYRTDVKDMAIGDLCNENGTLYRYNGTKWVSVYDTRLETVIKDLETVTQRTVSIITDLGDISEEVKETTTITDKLTGEIESINEEIANIKLNQESWVATFKKTGGNNLFSYALDLWESYSGIEEIYSDTEIIANSVSGKGYLIGSGSSKQSVEVQNGIYTVSFKYKRIGSTLATVTVKVNGEEFTLTETNWADFVYTIEVTTNHIEIEITSDTNDTLYVTDLLATIGPDKEVWTQNPNEIRTDTVTIGKGIKVESTEKNTLHKIDADGNRTYNKATNKVVAELTDKGLEAEEIISRGQAQMAGILIKQVGNQTWISSLL